MSVLYCAEDVPLFTMKNTLLQSPVPLAGVIQDGMMTAGETHFSKSPLTMTAKSEMAEESRRLHQEEWRKKQETACTAKGSCRHW